MEKSIFDELMNLNPEECSTVTFDNEVYEYLKDKHSTLNSELAIKEAASWEVATKFVLTD